ncbi:alpha/beta hydrolase [Candidatus Parcubacteria bacterium]|nr:MAG: alpha/beta hydrolase [Candidatus Parcubacteria bacterium]
MGLYKICQIQKITLKINLQNKMEKITFQTEDGVKIVADWYQPETQSQGKNERPKTDQPGIKKAILMLHMMPSDKTSWKSLAEKLTKVGFYCLATDLRGHGESTNSTKGPLNYNKFVDQEHQLSRLDVLGAIKFLKDIGFTKEKIVLIGASVGANLAIDYAAHNPDIKAIVALSPGLDYKGIEIEAAISKLTQKQFLLLAASQEDSYSFSSVKILSEKTKAQKQTKLFKNVGHGTDMLIKEKDLENEIVDWLIKIFK